MLIMAHRSSFYIVLTEVVTFFWFYVTLQEMQSQDGKLGFKYEGDVVDWSKTDFHFSYAVRLICNLLSDCVWINHGYTYVYGLRLQNSLFFGFH